MTIPDFQTLMLPMLRFASTCSEHSLRDAVDALAIQFPLTDEEKNAKIPSGKQPVFYNRVSWARGYLKQAGLLEGTGTRNYLRITERGREALRASPTKIDMKFLERYPEYLEFRERPRGLPEPEEDQVSSKLTPEELLGEAYGKMREDLAKDLLENILGSSSSFFENLVVELLVAMGYGGSGPDAGRAVGQSGDEGIDGIIDEDKLGLDSIYIQAKRWSETPVGRAEIQKFVGALQGKRARKGIFITASRFTDQARDYSANIDARVVLIDGKKLAELMIDYNVGVTTVRTYEIKSVDSDYFSETLE